MRRFLVAILVLLYSASAIGVPLHFHYCRGELKHVTLLVKMECHVPESGMAGHACCQKEYTQCGNALQSFNTCCNDATRWLQDHAPAVCPKDHAGDIQTKSGTDDIAVEHRIAPVPQITISDLLLRTESDTGDKAPRYLRFCALIYYG
jgi:hypothetical protein